jgi:hypothetical protein
MQMALTRTLPCDDETLAARVEHFGHGVMRYAMTCGAMAGEVGVVADLKWNFGVGEPSVVVRLN